MPGEPPGLGLAECSPDPPERGQVYPLVWPRPGPGYRCVCLSHQCSAYATHWLGQTRPCTGWEHGCDGCLRHQGRRWTGYLCGWETVALRQVVVVVSRCAALSAGLKGLRQRGVSLRGAGLSFRRAGLSRNSEVRLELLNVEADLAELPPAGPILPTLLALWGLEDYSPPIISLWKEERQDDREEGAQNPAL